MECYEKYLAAAEALREKRNQLCCKSMRKMFRKLRRGKGYHLHSIVEPHFQSCESCRTWARKKGFDPDHVLKGVV